VRRSTTAVSGADRMGHSSSNPSGPGQAVMSRRTELADHKLPYEHCVAARPVLGVLITSTD
jgi:hypothetical protein